MVGGHDEDREEESKEKVDRNDGRGLLDEGRGHVAVEYHSSVPVTDVGHCIEYQHEEGDCLDTAGSTNRRSANEHVKAAQKCGGFPESVLGHGSKAGGPEGDRLEDGVQDLVAQGHVTDGVGIVILQGKDENGAGDDETQGQDEYETGMLSQALQDPDRAVVFFDGLVTLGDKVEPDNKAKASQYDQGHGDHKDKGIVLERNKAVISDYVYTCVTEGGYRRKERDPGSLHGTIGRYESDHIKDSARKFHCEGALDDLHKETDKTCQGVKVKGVHYEDALLEGEPLLEDKGYKGGNCDDAKSAQLDEDQDNDLSEKGPVGICVNNYQAGNAYAGGCSKESGKGSGSLSLHCGYGQHQKYGPYQDHKEKSCRYYLC